MREVDSETLQFSGYPHHCYLYNPYDLCTALVYPGASNFYQVDPVKQACNASVLNRLEGITPAQEAAMEAGVKHGWADARANPMAYNAAGEYLGGA